jgi:pyruvate ferredoxin oxidoreductase gamma subunit
MGAPVMSFCRIDTKTIRTHEPVSEPDALIIQDPTLLHQAELFAGLGPEGYMLINSARGSGELGLDEFVQDFHRERLLVVPASALALSHLGRPLPGAPLPATRGAARAAPERDHCRSIKAPWKDLSGWPSDRRSAAR